MLPEGAPERWTDREIMNEDRRTASEHIARSVDPKRRANQVGSAKLANSNAAAVAACLAAARKTGRAQRCSIRIEADRGR